MVKKAPGWGKAIGIIMICLGGLSVFYQLYKLIFSMFFRTFGGFVNEVSRANPSNHGNRDMEVFNTIFGLGSGYHTLFIVFTILGLGMIVFYIIGGVKLLTAKPQNYNFARYALLLFIIYNAAQGLIFFPSNSGFFLKMVLIYSVVGFIFDLVLLIILTSSDRTAYGIGELARETGYDADVQYLEEQGDEVF